MGPMAAGPEPELESEHDDTAPGEHAGARWWSVDIHAHSPASFDYGGLEGEQNPEPKPSFKEWVRAYIDAGVDGVVIADHNSHHGIDEARRALEELRSEDPALPPFVIFPGVELTVTNGTHLLAIFDPGCQADVVDHTLVLCSYDGTRGESNRTANVTVADAAATIVRQGGICVPAHADKSRGVFRIDPRELEQLRGSPDIVAVEVVDDSEVAKATRMGWVPVLGSDAHHLTTDSCPEGETPKAPGSHVTLIKAETLDLEGVRLALTDPDESVRRCLRGYDDPNETSHGHIDRVEVVRGDTTHVYRFGPWMNCLIGGRGVGKSTVLELIRLALGRSDELKGVVAADLKRFDPLADPEERWWDDDTRIVVHYTKDQRKLRATWSGDSPRTSQIELWGSDGWETQSGRAADRTPIRVFSQKQIYELASSPQSFLTILDGMPEIRRAEWDEEYETLKNSFRVERNKLRQVLADTERADRIRGELEDVRGRLSHLEQLRASPQYRELDAVEARVRSADAVEEQAQSIESALTVHATALREIVPDPLRIEDYARRAESFAAAADLLDQAAVVLGAGRAEWAAGGAGAAWQQRVLELNEWLSEQGIAARTSVEQTQADRRREVELEVELRVIENSDLRRKEQQAVIDGILERIVAKRRELFDRRNEYTTQLSESGATLTKVEVFHQGDVGDLGGGLRGLLNCPDSFESAFASDGIPRTLRAEQPKAPGFPQKVEAFKEELIDLVEHGTDSRIGQSIRVDARFYTRLANADTFDMVTGILLWFPEDLVSVRYRQRESGNFVPVDRGSPGQRTAALLTVILQMGSEPLLLDQPEDDLENKLIKHLAVETLKEIKRQRQLLVSTHNANVVVTSGAENVLVLEHQQSAPQVTTEGTLQTPSVKENVCEILEGGEEAITTRYRRLVGRSSP